MATSYLNLIKYTLAILVMPCFYIEAMRKKVPVAYGPPKLRYSIPPKQRYKTREYFKACNKALLDAMLLERYEKLLDLKRKQLALMLSEERPDAAEIWKACVQKYSEACSKKRTL